MAKITYLLSIAAIAGATLLVEGCASTSSAHTACPDGTERTRVGPRGQAPIYVCQEKIDDKGVE